MQYHAMRQPTQKRSTLQHTDLCVTLLVLLAVAAIGLSQHQARAAVLGWVLADPRLVDPAAALRIAAALDLPTGPGLSSTTQVRPFSFISFVCFFLYYFFASSSLPQAF